jgi:hypothetical protein
MVTEYKEIGQSNDNAPGCLLALDSSGKPSNQTCAKCGGLVNASAFLDTNPTGELISVHHYSPNALADPRKPLVCSRHYA